LGRIVRQVGPSKRGPDLREAHVFPLGVSVQLDQLADFLSVLPATESQYDPNVFCGLTSAVIYRRRLDLRYWSASRDEKTRRAFDPYDLALVDDGRYTLGHCHLRNDIPTFAIQRVLSSREIGETYDRPPDFRVEVYPKGGFRPVQCDGADRVVLRFRPEVARRFEERLWRISPFFEPQPAGSRVVRSSSRASLRRILGRSCGRPERSCGLQGDVG